MTGIASRPITSVGELLAHALEQESESVLRYEELADSMEVHHNPEVEALFRKLAQFGVRHAESVRQRAQGVSLPEIAPWDFKWNCPGSPESDCGQDGVSYLMSVQQALELALHNEGRGHDFYAQVAATSPDPEVCRLAAEMAREEAEHVDLLRRWVARAGSGPDRPQEDLDPPNMPE
jgi:rubrerythrin